MIIRDVESKSNCGIQIKPHGTGSGQNYSIESSFVVIIIRNYNSKGVRYIYIYIFGVGLLLV